MFSWDKTGDRVAIVQLNAELRHAQLELLSAQCATDRLRLRFSADDIARHAQRDVLRRALLSASALHDYYNYVAQQLSDPDSLTTGASPWNENRVAEAADRLARYLREQRQQYFSTGEPLAEEHRHVVAPFFSAPVFEKVRFVHLEGSRVPNPSFFDEARALGLSNLPDFSHMHSLTFDDVVVFQEKISPRPLFHALVHAVQFDVLGLRRYAELFVRSFLRTRSYITVPLEAHAFTLESKFASGESEPFSVEEKVRLWAGQGRYEH